MTVARKAVATTISDSPAQVYQPASGYDGWVDGLTLANTHSAAVDVTLWRTTGGGTSTSTMVLPPKSIPAGTPYVAAELIGQWVLDGGTISALASVPGVVALNLSAREFSV